MEHEQELETLFGDGVLAVVRNPRLSIAQELEALGRLIAPPDSTVQVTIDRFTEFDIAIQLPAATSTSELAAICARLLEHDGKYLHRIRFYADKRLIGELDPSAISTAIASGPLDAALLAQALEKSVAEPSAPAGARERTANNEGMSAEDDALSELIGEWNASVDNRIYGIDDLITSLFETADLSTLKTKSDLSERLKNLESFTEKISSEQAYFARAMNSFREKLEGNDPLVVAIMMRNVKQRENGLLRQMKPLLMEVATLQSNARQLLEYLNLNPDGWNPAGGGRIEFTTAAAQVSFDVRFTEVAKSVKRIDERLRAMSEAAVPPSP